MKFVTVLSIASHSNSVLIPVAESDKPEFHFGMYDAVEYKDKLDALHYVMGKDMELYRRLSQSTELNFTQEDSIVYLLKTDDMLYDTGDMLSLNGTALYVLRADLLLKDAILACHYTLATKKAVAASTVYNEAITGLMLSGKVIEVKEDRVKVHLAIDEAQEKEKAYEFPYATGYAAEGHTGWYVMPEVGDTVRVVFPEEDENHAYAAMSLRQAESDKTTDPEVKYLRTPNGKEIKLDKEEILITGKDGITFVKINENTGIEIKTDKPILVSSGDTVTLKSASNFTIDSGKRLTIKAEEAIDILCQGNSVKLETETSGIEVDSKKPIKVTGDDNIDITSKKKMKISSDDDFNLSTKKNLDVSAGENVKMICKENKVNLEGEGGLTIASAKPMKVSGDEGIDISSGKDLNASSGANFNLSADAKLALSAVSTLEASCNDSSISIDGDINLKAKLINEN